MDQPERAVRASDAEREQVSRQLGAHAAAGRLTPEELDERLDAAYAARTTPTSIACSSDLPRPHRRRASPIAPARWRGRTWPIAPALSVIACLVCVGIWAAAGASGSFWPIWVILLAAVGLARASWRTLGPAATLSDEELGARRRARAASLPSPVAITTAVVPVAGLATRLRPLSRGVPKGLLPVAGRPVIQHIVDELEACGIERVVLVTGRGRAAFAAHFADSRGPEMACVDQPEPLGLGDAILRAAPLLDGPFVIALGDALLGRGAPARVVQRLVAAVEAGAGAAVAVEEVAADETRRYGIVAPAGEGDPFADRRGRREAGARDGAQPAGGRRALRGDARAARRAARDRRATPAARSSSPTPSARWTASSPCAWRPARSAWTSGPCPATARRSSSTR